MYADYDEFERCNAKQLARDDWYDQADDEWTDERIYDALFDATDNLLGAYRDAVEGKCIQAIRAQADAAYRTLEEDLYWLKLGTSEAAAVVGHAVELLESGVADELVSDLLYSAYVLTRSLNEARSAV